MTTPYSDELVRKTQGMPLTLDEVLPELRYKPTALDNCDGAYAATPLETYVVCDQCDTPHVVDTPLVPNLIWTCEICSERNVTRD